MEAPVTATQPMTLAHDPQDNSQGTVISDHSPISEKLEKKEPDEASSNLSSRQPAPYLSPPASAASSSKASLHSLLGISPAQTKSSIPPGADLDELLLMDLMGVGPGTSLPSKSPKPLKVTVKSRSQNNPTISQPSFSVVPATIHSSHSQTQNSINNRSSVPIAYPQTGQKKLPGQHPVPEGVSSSTGAKHPPSYMPPALKKSNDGISTYSSPLPQTGQKKLPMQISSMPPIPPSATGSKFPAGYSPLEQDDDELDENMLMDLVGDDNDNVNNMPQRDSSGMFVCPKCGKGFAKSGAMRRHLMTHSENKPHKCDLCEKSFMRLDSLMEHKNVTHGVGDRPFKCDKCQKDFVSAKRLREHKRSHELRPFSCSKCLKGFAQQHLLDQHLRTHDETREFECPECHKRFDKERLLKSHMHSHSTDRPFECEVCHKRFKDKRHLKDHHYLHEDVSRWKCKFCGQAFQTRSRLGHHKCSMGGSRPLIPCPQAGCDKSFDSQSKLNRHLSAIHKIEVTNMRSSDDSGSSDSLSSLSSISMSDSDDEGQRDKPEGGEEQ